MKFYIFCPGTNTTVISFHSSTCLLTQTKNCLEVGTSSTTDRQRYGCIWMVIKIPCNAEKHGSTFSEYCRLWLIYLTHLSDCISDSFVWLHLWLILSDCISDSFVWLHLLTHLSDCISDSFVWLHLCLIFLTAFLDSSFWLICQTHLWLICLTASLTHLSDCISDSFVWLHLLTHLSDCISDSFVWLTSLSHFSDCISWLIFLTHLSDSSLTHLSDCISDSFVWLHLWLICLTASLDSSFWLHLWLICLITSLSQLSDCISWLIFLTHLSDSSLTYLSDCISDSFVWLHLCSSCLTAFLTRLWPHLSFNCLTCSTLEFVHCGFFVAAFLHRPHFKKHDFHRPSAPSGVARSSRKCSQLFQLRVSSAETNQCIGRWWRLSGQFHSEFIYCSVTSVSTFN